MTTTFSPEEIEKVIQELRNQSLAKRFGIDFKDIAIWHLTQTTSLRQEIEGLRKDKERLDWLEKVSNESGYHVELRGLSIPQSNAMIIRTGCGSGAFMRNYKGQSGPNPLRSAIDAAMQPAKEAK